MSKKREEVPGGASVVMRRSESCHFATDKAGSRKLFTIESSSLRNYKRVPTCAALYDYVFVFGMYLEKYESSDIVSICRFGRNNEFFEECLCHYGHYLLV